MCISASLKYILKFKLILILLFFAILFLLPTKNTFAASSQCKFQSNCPNGTSCVAYGDLREGQCFLTGDCCNNPELSNPPADLTPPAGTQTTPPPQQGIPNSAPNGNVDNILGATTGQTIDSKNYLAAQHANFTFLNLLHTVRCIGSGSDIVTNEKCIDFTHPKKAGAVVEPMLFAQTPSGGALGSINNVMIALYDNPPLSTSQYLANVGTNLGLIKPVYAQVNGSGGNVLAPVLQLWTITRNLAYLIFIVIFLVVGFMVMFRQKINPQTVISAQTALPGLVISLILVTFSYFIAALIVDTSFVGMRLVGAFFSSVTSPAIISSADAQHLATTSNVFDLWGFSMRLIDWGGTFMKIIEVALTPSLTQSIGSIVTKTSGPVGAISLVPVVGDWINQGVGSVITTVIGGVGAGILFVIIIIALTIQFFRLLWSLITAYVAVFTMTIAGPILILFSALPGKNGAITLWWKTILGNVLIFPAVFAGFLFAGAMFKANNVTSTLPLLGIGANLMPTVIGLGILLGLPAIPGMVRSALKVPELAGIPQAAMAGFMGGANASRAVYNRYTQGPRQEQQAWREADLRRRFTPIVPGQPQPQPVPRPRRTFPWIY